MFELLLVHTGLVKDFTPAQSVFAQENGYQRLGQCLSSGVEKLVIKAAFLVANIVEHCHDNGGNEVKNNLLCVL